MNSSEERKNIIDRVVKKIKSGDNILCSMEAAVNISANVLVNKLFPGMIYAALESDALILPVAIERFDSKLYSVNVSDIFFDARNHFNTHEISKENISAYAELIRQKLADLKFQSYYDKYIYKRIETNRNKLGNYDEYNELFKKRYFKRLDI